VGGRMTRSRIIGGVGLGCSLVCMAVYLLTYPLDVQNRPGLIALGGLYAPEGAVFRVRNGKLECYEGDDPHVIVSPTVFRVRSALFVAVVCVAFLTSALLLVRNDTAP